MTMRCAGYCARKLAVISMLALVSTTSAALWPEAAPGSNDTDSCSKLYVDVGANVGQSLKWWYQPKDYGRGSKEFARVASFQERREFCTDIFEAEPNQTQTLMLVAKNLRVWGHRVKLYASTPFSLMGGDILFNSIGAVNDGGGTVAKAANDAAAPDVTSKAIKLRSMNAIEYLRNLKATTLALKIDVESYEFELVRGLVVSGALCVPGRRTFLLIEWHLPRLQANGTYRNIFDENKFGLPALTVDKPQPKQSHERWAPNSHAVAVKDAILWMLQSPACANTTYIRWY